VKKLLIIASILAIAVFASAFNQRGFYKQLLIDGGDIMTYVNTASPAHDADFALSVTDVATGDVISTAANSANVVRVCTLTGPSGLDAWVFFNAQGFPTTGNVPAGRVFAVTLTYVGNADPLTNFVTFNVTAPTGTGAVWLYGANAQTLPLNMFGAPEATYTVNMSTNPAGYITPTILGPTTDVTTTYGTYTPDPLPAPATGYWTPAFLTIDATTVWTADGPNWVLNQEFVWTEVNTYSYTLYVTGPDGYVVTGPVAGTTDYIASNADQAMLLGNYTIAAAPDGFHWEVNPINVNADGWNLVTKKGDVAGTRTSAPKAHFVYEKTIEFMLVRNVIDMENPPAGVVITPGADNFNNGPDTGQPWQGWTITGTGTWDIVVTNPYPTLPWWAWIKVGLNWIEAANPIGTPTYTFVGVNLDGKGESQIIVNDNSTLPVELSSFTAVLTANNFVKLTWVSQSETEMLGYRVYRGESGDQASAIMITPTMIGATNTSTTQSYSITDNEVSIGSTYWYWLESVDYASSHFHGPVSIIVEGEVPPVLPETTTMKNAYPNPFRMNSSTTIDVAVKAGENGIVTIYNILGQAVKTFKVSEGTTKINWNGRDAKGNACGSGIYFYKLSTPSMNQTKKMVIVK